MLVHPQTNSAGQAGTTTVESSGCFKLKLEVVTDWMPHGAWTAMGVAA